MERSGTTIHLRIGIGKDSRNFTWARPQIN
jgi:hypothetical protein